MFKMTGVDLGSWAEKLFLVIVIAVYLIAFSSELTNGDAMIYVTHLKEGLFYWNPNHLLMDPVAYCWHKLLGFIYSGITPTQSLKMLSGGASIITLLIFHSTLKILNVPSPELRIIGVLGLFFSRYFLSMSVSEYFFIIQMPFLVLVLWYFVGWFKNEKKQGVYSKELFLAGVMLGVACAVQINNVVLLILLGVLVGALGRKENAWQYKYTASIWGGAAIFCVPLFIFGFITSGTDANLISWMTSYQGSSDNPSQNLYGIQWTVNGVLISTARLGFNMVANFTDTGGLGTVLKSLAFSLPLEYKPNYLHVLLSGLLVIMILGLLTLVTIWLIRNYKKSIFIKFSSVWLFAYLLFNFLWNDSTDQFWIQLLPIMWLLIFMYMGFVFCGSDEGLSIKISHLNLKKLALRCFVIILALLNTLQFVLPIAYAGLDEKTKQHKALIKNAGLEIITGWDDLRWLSLDKSDIKVDRVILMHVALQRDGRLKTINELRDMIKARLDHGERVVISRVYDLDNTPRPWDHLARLGWSREKIQDALSEFESREIARVGDVVFRELRIK